MSKSNDDDAFEVSPGAGRQRKSPSSPRAFSNRQTRAG